MGKIHNELTAQLSESGKEQDAKDCLKIYDKLMELNDGHLWSSEWELLTQTIFVGKYPNNRRTYKPSAIGRIFVVGLEQTENSH